MAQVHRLPMLTPPPQRSRVTLFAGLWLALFGARLWLVHRFGTDLPWWDAWDSEGAHLLTPWLQGALSPQMLFSPHNEHRVVPYRLVTLALFELNHRWSPLLHLSFNAAASATGLTALGVWVSRSLSARARPWLTMMLFVLNALPFAWENVFMTIQTVVYFAQGFGVAAAWALTQYDGGTRRWWLGALCAALAALSFSSGLMVLPAVALVLVWRWLREGRVGRWPVLVAPVLLAAFAFGVAVAPVVPGHLPLRAHTVSDFIDGLLKVWSWPFGPSPVMSLVLQAPVLLLVVSALRSQPQRPRGDWFLLTLVTWVGVMQVSTAHTRNAVVLSSRYLDTWALSLLLSGACLLWWAHRQTTRPVLVRAGVSLWWGVALTGIATQAPVSWHELETNALTWSQELQATRTILRAPETPLAGAPLPYPLESRLRSILAFAPLRQRLPAVLADPLMPSSSEGLIEGAPSGAWVPGELWWHTVTGVTPAPEARLVFSSAPFSSTLRVGIAGAATPETRVEVEQSGHRRPVQISTAQHDGWREGFVQVYRNPFSLVITNAPPGGLQISAPMMLGRYDRPVLALLEGSWAILAMGLALWLWGTWRALRTEV